MENPHGAATPMKLDLAKDCEEKYNSCLPETHFAAAGRVLWFLKSTAHTAYTSQQRRQRYRGLHGLQLGKQQCRPQIAGRIRIYLKQLCHLVAIAEARFNG